MKIRFTLPGSLTLLQTMSKVIVYH